MLERSRMRFAWLLLIAACAVDPSGLFEEADTDGSPRDAEAGDARVDAAAGDLGPVDLGADFGPVDPGPDLGPADLGPPDLGSPDLGPPDLGSPDLGPPDLGPPDLGPPDLGPPDLGPPDLGPPDLGPPDMGCGTDETCNGADDDCDGAIDEAVGGGGNACAFCTRGVSPGGSTYQFCPDARAWDDARDICRAFGYELASPETMAEDTYLDGQITDAEDWWLALNDQDSEGSFEWEDRPSDRPLGAFSDWDSGEPNNGTSENCVRINAGTRRWRTSDCNGFTQDSNYYICEAR